MNKVVHLAEYNTVLECACGGQYWQVILDDSTPSGDLETFTVKGYQCGNEHCGVFLAVELVVEGT